MQNLRHMIEHDMIRLRSTEWGRDEKYTRQKEREQTGRL